jgi:uncharacterized membrane protein
MGLNFEMTQYVSRHVTRCFLAGIVALLPIGGFILTVAYLEAMIAGSWLARQSYYLPGLGIVATAAAIYLIGLTVSTFLGRWLWERVDLLFDSLPALGRLYQTLKQIIGYGEGKDAIFQRVVLIRGSEPDGSELGLVTNETTDDGGNEKLIVFVPGAPNPTSGRLIVIDAARTIALSVTVHDALKTLLSVGKTPVSLAAVRTPADSATVP